MSDLVKLPSWSAPDSLEDARAAILNLGRSLSEHAYLIGRHLIWIKDQVGHGKFLPWVKDNVWFGERTARYMMAHAERCDAAVKLLAYHPKSATVAELTDRQDSSVTLTRYLEELRRLRHDLIDLEWEFERAWTVEECAEIQKAAAEAANRAAEIKIRSEVEIGKLLTEMMGFFGFAPTPDQLPGIVMACNDRIAELRNAS